MPILFGHNIEVMLHVGNTENTIMGAEEGVLQRVHQSLRSSIIPFPPLLLEKWCKLSIKVTLSSIQMVKLGVIILTEKDG